MQIGDNYYDMKCHDISISDMNPSHRMGFTPLWVRSRRVWKSLYLRKSNRAECRAKKSKSNL